MKKAQAVCAISRWSCKPSQTRLHLQAEVCLVPNRGSNYSYSTQTGSRRKLPETPARTRFAPSPTGNLHLGSIRTALFNYLLAKKTNGQFLLRLEDTDQKRTVAGAEDRLYRDLQWAGLQWDEGPIVGGPFGPYRQSERVPTYQKHIRSLLENGRVYRCFCSSERLDDLNRRRHQKGLNLGYDRKCADLPVDQAEERAHQGESHVVRFRSPLHWPRYFDLVYGKTGHGADKAKKLLVDEPVYEDTVLIKSDGFPTYHWANICDDHEMNITHVIRGSEWMSSTPLHVALYESLGWQPPFYAHVPLLVDQNGQKLSKRNFDSDIASFSTSGIFPDTLTNFAALLGWSHQQKTDVMDLKELEAAFDLKITKGNTIVSFDKLKFLQEQHAKRRIAAEGKQFEQMIRDVAVAVLDKYGAPVVSAFVGKRKLRDVVASMLRAESLPFRSASQYANQCSIFFESGQRAPLDAQDPSMRKELRVAAATLCLVPEEHWTKEVHRTNLQNLQLPSSMAAGIASDAKKGKRDLYHYMRWALLGGVAGPSIPETMEILGRQTCVERIQSAAHEVQDAMIMDTKPTLLKAQKFEK